MTFWCWLIVRIVQRVNPEKTPWWNYVYVSFTVKSSKTNVLITMFTITFSKAWDLSASNTWCVWSLLVFSLGLTVNMLAFLITHDSCQESLLASAKIRSLFFFYNCCRPGFSLRFPWTNKANLVDLGKYLKRRQWGGVFFASLITFSPWTPVTFVRFWYSGYGWEVLQWGLYDYMHNCYFW